MFSQIGYYLHSVYLFNAVEFKPDHASIKPASTPLRGCSHRMRFSIPMRCVSVVFLCKHTRRTCMAIALASCIFCCVLHVSGTFIRCCVKLKELQILLAVPLINVSSKTMDQSEDTRGGASFASFYLQYRFIWRQHDGGGILRCAKKKWMLRLVFLDAKMRSVWTAP